MVSQFKYNLNDPTYPCHVAVQAHQIEELIRVGSVVVQAVDHHDGALKEQQRQQEDKEKWENNRS